MISNTTAIHPDWTLSEVLAVIISDKTQEEFRLAWCEEPACIQDEFGGDIPLWNFFDPEEGPERPSKKTSMTYEEYINLVKIARSKVQ